MYMSYAVELSLDINTSGVEWNKMIEERKQVANKHECDIQYFTHDIEGKGNKIINNDSIQVVIFEKEKINNLIEYIKEIRSYKKNYIECIYQDDVTCDLLYASPKYIRKMDKIQGKIFKRERKYWVPNTDIEKRVYEAIGKRKKI